MVKEQMKRLPSLDDWVPGSRSGPHLERRWSGSLSFQQGLPESRGRGRSAAGTLV